MKNIINFINTITNPENNKIHIVALCLSVIAALACAYVLFVPNAIAEVEIAISVIIIIMYDVIYVIKHIKTEIETYKAQHNKEVVRLENVFGEMHKHPLFECPNVVFIKKNTKEIEEILTQFINEHSVYGTEYYDKLIHDCKIARAHLDDLLNK